MRLKTGFTLMSVLAFLVLAVVSWPKDESSSDETFISRSRSLEVWAEGTPAVKMRGQIEVSGTNGTVARGDYAVDWVSPSQWREEIQFANYQRIRIRDAQGFWQKASLDYQPYLIYMVTDLLDLKTALSVSPKETFGRVKSRQKDGILQKCVDLNITNRTNRVLCFDDKSGALLAVEYPQGEHDNPPELSRIEYTDFHSVAGKLIPYDRRALRGGKTIASVRIAEVSKADSVNSAEFMPPPSAEFWPQCDSLQKANLARHVAPNYPQAAGRNREMGRVILYGVVEADGTLSHLKLIKSASPAMNEAAMESFGRSQYTPAQCQGNSIRSESFFEMDFQIHQ
jgi:TonB family protein